MDFSIYLGDFRHRVFASTARVGTLCQLRHSACNKLGKGTIYLVIDKIRDRQFEVLKLKPIYGRNQQIKTISGCRYIYIKR